MRALYGSPPPAPQPVGFGTGLRVVITVGGQSSADPARFDYAPPSVQSFVRYAVNPAVCTPPAAPTCGPVAPLDPAANATTQCQLVYPGCYPTAGGFPLQLLGNSFGVGVGVWAAQVRGGRGQRLSTRSL